MHVLVEDADPAHAMLTHYVGRQPILDAEQDVFGYELLFRCGPENSFSGESDEATRQVIDNALLLGLETLTANANAFLNCTRETLVQRLVTTLPPAKTVLEIPNTIEVDDELEEACAELREMGYRLSLGNFKLGTTAVRLVPLAEFAKVDLRTLDLPILGERCLEPVHRQVAGLKLKWIAEKVETQKDFERARTAGFTYFQGYFFAYPTILTRREIPPSQMLYLQLMGALSRTPYDERQVERLVMAEASLCFRLLRLANSPALATRGKITSIRQALLWIGQDEFRKLVTVASATSFGKRFKMPSELILLALHRARFCELIAPLAQQTEGEQYLIGLLSAFNAILQIPTEQIVEMLPLREEAAGALLGQETSAALPYQLLRAYEARQWVRCARVCHKLRIAEAQVTAMYLTALQWATKEIRDAGM